MNVDENLWKSYQADSDRLMREVFEQFPVETTPVRDVAYSAATGVLLATELLHEAGRRFVEQEKRIAALEKRLAGVCEINNLRLSEIRRLAEDRRAEARDGGRCDVDHVLPSEILAILDGSDGS